jgi:dipeptidyl aminopeptidase/acylaminoacyl peptidase
MCFPHPDVVMIPIRSLPIVFLAVVLPGCSLRPPAPPALPAAAPAATGALPATDIFLLHLAEQNGEVRISPSADRRTARPRASNITDRDGYDNQPAFTPDGRFLLYTSIREDRQADIYRYDTRRGVTVRLTRTPESEYSPTPTPDGRGFSVIRVEADSTQRLWRFDRRGRNPRLVLERIEPVGYHAWADENILALFVLGAPATLQVADTRTGLAEPVARDIGRSLHPIPERRAISFVHKARDGEWWIRALDPRTRMITPIARTLPGVEDLAWTPAGTLLVGQESTLFRWDPVAGEWRPVVDLSAVGIRGITRLAVSPTGDRIAVVGRRE